VRPEQIRVATERRERKSDPMREKWLACASGLRNALTICSAVMAAEMMTFAYLRRSADATARVTRENLRGANEHVPTAVDAILKLPYFVPTAADADISGYRWAAP
jgi:hypothetical protein